MLWGHAVELQTYYFQPFKLTRMWTTRDSGEIARRILQQKDLISLEL